MVRGLRGPGVSAGGAHYRWDGADLLLDLHGKPGARRDEFGAVIEGRLTVKIAAVAVDGKATTHLCAFLAREFGVSKSALEVVYGAASVNKRIRIRAPKSLPQAAAIAAPADPVKAVPGSASKLRRRRS